MIRYALICADCQSEFEAWFASSAAFDSQAKAGLVECVTCDSHRVTKQIMAPAIRTSGKKHAPKAPESTSTQSLIEATRDHIAKTCEYTGDQFPEEARAMYYGETKERSIWGKTTPKEAKALHDEGITALPLPAPLAPKLPPKSPKDKSKLN